MENLAKCATIFAILTPANSAARDAFSKLAQKMLDDESWNRNARQHIESNNHPVQVSTYDDASESEGGTGPGPKLRPVLRGCYIFDFAKAPGQPDKGWLIGGGKFSKDDQGPDILLTERKAKSGVSSGHARLRHNFQSGALVISVLNGNATWINGHEVVHNQRVIHGLTTSLEFGRLKYDLEVRKYDTDEQYRQHLRVYKANHAIPDDEYPFTIQATPADSDLVTKNYIIKNPIGEGSTCVVYAAHHRWSGTAVAVKKVRRTHENAKAIECDIAISKSIGEHNSICYLVDVIDNHGCQMYGLDEVFLVYIPLANWTLEFFIDYGEVVKLTTCEKIFWQLLEGIGFLHSNNIMHRDIKPLNMAVISIAPDRPEARLIDFSLAKFGLESDQYYAGTPSYMAPEMWAGAEARTKDKYNEKVDIFAFGLSMFQFFCHQPCRWNRIDQDAGGRINEVTLEQVEHSLIYSSTPSEIKEWIQSFINWDPRMRPSAKDALELRGKVQSQKERAEDSTSENEIDVDKVNDDEVDEDEVDEDDGGAGV